MAAFKRLLQRVGWRKKEIHGSALSPRVYHP